LSRRVVVTGISLLTPLGLDAPTNWERACEGKSGLGPITRFDASRHASRVAGEIKGFDPLNYIEAKEIKKMDPFIHYVLAASDMAMEDAGLDMSKEDCYRAGVVVGSGMGGLATVEKYHKVLMDSSPRKISPFFVPMIIINLAPGQISIRTGAKGPNFSTNSACASGTHAIGSAYKIIQRNEADVMICGGTEAVITPLCVAGFANMKALSTRNDEPEKACRPFDRDRDGFVIAEGAGLVILEELEHARKRGAKIYAEMVGFGMSSDSYHISAPDPQGDGARRCMENCLKDGNIAPEKIDYISAHGTSTPWNDKLETLAIKTVIGDHASSVSISSIKSMLGHTLGAAGGVAAAFLALSIYHSIIPPTINYENPDPGCDLDYTPNIARKREIRVGLSNSFGFGGTNATIAFRRFSQ
jgi:3-oxoacyl-[acyl-carrier-protein] synthase II